MKTTEMIEAAIREAVDEAGQDQALANRIVRWFDSVASGNENIEDADAVNARLKSIYDVTALSKGNDNEDES